MTQQQMMIRLFWEHRDEDAVIQAYANAERRGEVSRRSNVNGTSPEEYARRLWYDGVAKGWLPVTSAEPRLPYVVAATTGGQSDETQTAVQKMLQEFLDVPRVQRPMQRQAPLPEPMNWQPEIPLRQQLVACALAWEQQFGIAPQITSAISELDAATLVGMPCEDYGRCMVGRTAVSKGYDFEFRGIRYQVKGNRPSGKPGSFVTLVSKAKNYDWDRLVWVLYNSRYEVAEAWEWRVQDYMSKFGSTERLSPSHMRLGRRLAPPA